jgi:dolichyl-phosphate-mannose--protein O-mannosyl transferase
MSSLSEWIKYTSIFPVATTMFTFMADAFTVFSMESLALVVNAAVDKNTAVNAVANAVLIEVFISLSFMFFNFFVYKTTPIRKRFNEKRAFIPG